jgi:hypothetical protein
VIPTPETVAALVKSAVMSYDANRPRSIQAREGVIGPSDLGFCKQKALLTLRGVPYSDSRSIWPAVVGTAVGEFVEAALKQMFPHWIVGSIDGVRLGYELGNGAVVTGTGDVIAPDFNAAFDLKTKDGLILVKRKPPTRNYRYQRHAYVRGAVQAGLLDPDKPLYVGNIYLDRSGKDDDPYVQLEEVDPTLDDEITAWVDDVIYARLHNEDAEREVAPAVCEKICEFFTVCRGTLPVSDGLEVFEDEETLDALEVYITSRETGKVMKAQMEEAAGYLRGKNGIGHGHQVRTTFIPATNSKAEHDRLEVTPIRGRQGRSDG